MSGPMMAALAALVLFTAFLSGIFGMAGGMILMGGLLLMMPVADAMVLHGITQLSANGWRAMLWARWVMPRVVGRYALGLAAASGLFLGVSFVPDPQVVLIVLGLAPFVGRALPARMVPQVGNRLGAETCGFVCTSLQLLSGVSGPMLDLFFARSEIDRRRVVATKAACQILTHLTKLVYFGALAVGATGVGLDPLLVGIAIAMALLGTTLSRQVLERLTDQGFRRYTWWLIMAVGAAYLVAAVFV